MFTLSSCHLVILSYLPLADSDGGAGKFIGALFFLAIWALAGINGWLKKRQEQQKRDRMHQPAPLPPMPQQQRQQPHRRPVQTGRRTAPPPLSRVPSPQLQTVKQPVRRSQAATPAPAPVPPPPAPAPAHHPDAPARARRPSLTAAAISGWLKPKTLRQQFILTEVFQPPVTMRDHLQ